MSEYLYCLSAVKREEGVVERSFFASKQSYANMKHDFYCGLVQLQVIRHNDPCKIYL